MTTTTEIVPLSTTRHLLTVGGQGACRKIIAARDLPLNTRLDGAEMNYVTGALACLAVIAGAPPTTTVRCPTTVQSLAKIPTFSTLFGATGCVTGPAKAFLVIYEARDIEGLRTLAKAPTAAAQLYALCGLKHLHVEPDATVLRRELSSSSKKTTIEFGDPEPLIPTAVSSLVVAKKGQPSSEFDVTCDILVGAGRNPRAPARRTCSSDSARLTCR